MTILGDTTKFSWLSPVDTYNHTVYINAKLQKKLIKWVRSFLLPSTIFDLIRPVGSIRFHPYGWPKTHKDGVSSRPILSMKGCPQYMFGQ